MCRCAAGGIAQVARAEIQKATQLEPCQQTLIETLMSTGRYMRRISR